MIFFNILFYLGKLNHRNDKKKAILVLLYGLGANYYRHIKLSVIEHRNTS